MRKLPNFLKGLKKDDILHEFCIGCSAPFLNIFFNGPEVDRLELMGLKKKKQKGCGCPYSKK